MPSPASSHGGAPSGTAGGDLAGSYPNPTIAPGAGALARLLYGDSSDGDVTIGANTSLTRDMLYNNLTVSAGFTLNANGFRVFVRATLTNRGTIRAGANDGSTFHGGVGVAGSMLGGEDGGDGVDLLVGAGSPGLDWGGGQYGGNGGAGGAAGAQAGGAGGTSVTSTALQGTVRALPMTVGTVHALGGGASGGGGGSNSVTADSGGGGSGGGTLLLAARTFDNAGGVLHADGGAGAAASGSGAAGGGGGGGGGLVIVMYDTLTAAGTIRAAGGAGGAGQSTGAAGVAGSVGQTVQLSNTA